MPITLSLTNEQARHLVAVLDATHESLSRRKSLPRGLSLGEHTDRLVTCSGVAMDCRNALERERALEERDVNEGLGRPSMGDV